MLNVALSRAARFMGSQGFCVVEGDILSAFDNVSV